MAGIKERLIQFVLRGKDELSPEADKSAVALGALREEAEGLGKALDSAKDARGLAKGLESTQRAVEQAERSLVQADLQVKELRDALNKAPEAAGLQQSLKDAEREARRSQKALGELQAKLSDQAKAAKAAGIDTSKLADEEKRLAAEVEKAKTALSENAAAVSQLKREQAAATRTTAELEKKVQGAAKAARELLNGQREGVAATEAHSSALAGSVRQLAAYAAGFLGLTAIIGRVTAGIRSMLQTGDQFELLSKRMSALMGSIEGGAQATAWIKDFARDTPLAVADVSEAFAKLKAFGLDPMDGTLQALVDQNEKLGGGMERLQGIVGAVGQAWAKQKLQTEEILQLVERGVPAWDLLAEVTGKNGAALQDMATKGELGRDVIKQLVAEIGRTSSGAAADSMDTLTGLVSNLGDAWTDFLTRAANSGALDYVKARLQALSDAVAKMAADGSLDRMAKRFSDSFVAVAKSIEGAGQWIAQHATELKALAAAYAAFKLAGMVASMARWSVSLQTSSANMRVLAAETNAAAAATGRLGAAQVAAGAMGKLGGAVVGVASSLQFLAVRMAGWVGLATLAVDAGKPLGEWFAKMSPAVKEAEASIARATLAMQANYEAAKQQASALADAAGVQIKSAADLRAASDEEKQAYAQRLKALEQYQKAQLRVATIGQMVGDVTQEEAAKARDALRQTAEAFAAIDAAAKFTDDAFRGKLTVGALSLVEAFNELRRSGMDAEQVLAQLGKDFDPTSADQLRDMGVLLQYLGQYGIVSGEQIEQFLSGKLEKLSSKDLLRVQQVAKDVFDGLGRGAESLALVVDASLGQALQQLGIDLEEVRTGFDKGTRETLAAFAEVVSVQQASGRSAEDTAKVIEAAYVAARQKINDPAALDQLDAAFQGAAKAAGLTATQISSSMAEARGGVEKASTSIRSMEDALSRIGSASSTMELANIGVAASRAFHQGRMSAEQYAKVQEALKAKTRELKGSVDELVQAQEKLTRSQEMQNEAMEDGVTTSEELRRISGQRMEEERRASGEAMELRRKGAEEAQKDMGVMADFFGGVMTSAREPLAQLSEAALQAFDRLRGISTVDIELDTSSAESTAEALERATDALDNLQSAASTVGMTGLGRWMTDTLLQSQRLQVQYLEQKKALLSLMEGYEAGEISGRAFVEQAKSARGAMSLLNDSDLRTLEGAIDSAKDRMQQLGESSRTTLESLQDELDKLQGNEADIERRRFASRRRELEAQFAEAQKSGDPNTVANLQRALSMLRTVEAETAAQSEREAQQKRVEQASAPAPAAAQQPTKVIRLETARGKSVDLQVAENDETNLLSILEDAGLRSL